MTDIQGFFGNKNVNVVSPLGGAFSWYTDWVDDRSKQYQTYMTKELPPLINAQYKTNGKNAVGGLSSTGGTAIDYAIQAPGLYRAVGSYSGFPAPSDPGAAERLADPRRRRRECRRHVGSRSAARCGWRTTRRRTSPNSRASRCTPPRRAAARATSTDCRQASEQLHRRTHRGHRRRQHQDSSPTPPAAAGVPVTYVVRPEGSHTWGLFESEMQESWNTTIGPALGAAARV